MQALSDWDFTCRDVNEMCFCFKCEFPLVKGNILTLETCQKCFLSNRWIRKEYHLWPNYHVAPIYLSDNPPNLQCPAAPSEHHYNRHTTDPQLLNSSNEILWLTYSLNHPCFELLECPCMYGIKRSWHLMTSGPIASERRNQAAVETPSRRVRSEWVVTACSRIHDAAGTETCLQQPSLVTCLPGLWQTGQKERYQFLQY